MVFPSDLEIARGAALKPLEDIADAMGIASHLLEPHGEEVMKIKLEAIAELAGQPAAKAATQVSRDAPISIADTGEPGYVSRGGRKLAGALAALAGNAVVTAAVTDTWEAARKGFARLLGHGDPDKTKLAERRLAETAEKEIWNGTTLIGQDTNGKK